LYPVCNERHEILGNFALAVDVGRKSVHFWDPMKDQFLFAASHAPVAAAADLRASMGMIITTTITTTPTRGAIG
jgi:hypothetical protein